jgi:hypothetical protein
MQARGWLVEITGQGRNRLWRYQPYLDLFHGDAPASGTAALHPPSAFTA